VSQSIAPEPGTDVPSNPNEILLLQEAFGPRYRRIGPRKVVLNLTFWAHFLAGRMQLAYHVQQECFLLPTPGAKGVERVSVEELFKFTVHGLQQAAKLEPNKFPAAEIRLPRIKMLIEEMKLAAAVHTPGERDALVQFLNEEVAPQKRCDLTVAEIHGRYVANCRVKMRPVFPLSVFQRLLPRFVKDIFCVTKSHDLRRTAADGSIHWHKGFHGLSFTGG